MYVHTYFKHVNCIYIHTLRIIDTTQKQMYLPEKPNGHTHIPSTEQMGKLVGKNLQSTVQFGW